MVMSWVQFGTHARVGRVLHYLLQVWFYGTVVTEKEDQNVSLHW